MTFPIRASVLLAGGAAVLLGAIGLVAYGAVRPLPEPRFKGKLADVLPTAEEVPGWRIKQEEIAEAPEMKRTVTEILNFDDAVFTSYTRGSDRISIYLAYWQPGKMPHRAIAGHTPDVCWVGGGWTVADARVADTLTAAGGAAVVPAEQRDMRFGRTSERVLFWHLVDGERMSYGSARPPWHAAITDTWRKGLDQRAEQFFIRISSPQPVDEWWTNEVVQALLAKMHRSGVPIFERGDGREG